MPPPPPPHPLLLLLLFIAVLLRHSGADVGTAVSYGPPYLPTRCFGNDSSPFPADAAFAAAGAGIWDNGAACSQRYIVRCLSSSTPSACLSGAVVEVTVVDQAAESLATNTMALSEASFAAIAIQNATEINIEFAHL